MATLSASPAVSNGEKYSLVSLTALTIVILIGVYSAQVGAEIPPNPITADWDDPMFAKPYIDVDEWRDTPVRHRYVHGGFEGTETLFSMYFPPKDQYEGRFFQHIAAVSGNENLYADSWDVGFSLENGAYYVESNLGKKDMYPSSTDMELNKIIGYRASAAVAKYSRVLAVEMYGLHRAFGYVYGGSGGAFKTMSCVESTIGIWDGSVPYIHGTPMSLPYNYTLRGQALRVLDGKFAGIIDAVEPGGSGDMYAGLNKEERAALREITLHGFPPRAWFFHERFGMGPLSVLIDHMRVWDPTYFEDFWKSPGYLGANPPESFARARIRKSTKVSKVVMADEARELGLPVPMAARAAGSAGVVPAAFQVRDLPKGYLIGASLILKSGAAEDSLVYISDVIGDYITVSFGEEAYGIVSGIKVGDEVEIDNSIYLASESYQRHQVPSPDYHAWDQYRGSDGKPLYPQRAEVLGPKFSMLNGSIQTGRFHGKMIVVNMLVDEYAKPWSADWYRARAKEHHGAHLDDNYRLWYIDHALHGQPRQKSDNIRVVNYTGVLQQALLDVSAWVEKGTPPPQSTSYEMVRNQVVVPPTAAERKGIQPVVTLSANGRERADVKVGQPVTFSAIAEVPPETGSIVKAEWDFEGTGDYPIIERLRDTESPRVELKTTYSFSKPGTYFPAIRVASHRQEDPKDPYARVMNLGRVRVVVVN